MKKMSKHKGIDKLVDNKEFMEDMRLVGQVFNTSPGLKLLLKWRRQFVETSQYDPDSVRGTDHNLGKMDFVLGIMTDIDNLEKLEGYTQRKLDTIANKEVEEIEEIELEEEPKAHDRMDGGLGASPPKGKG